MSRSRRHIPIFDHGNTASEKDDKQRASMHECKKIKNKVKPYLAGIEDFDVVDHVSHPLSGQWVFAKGGKSY